MRSSAFIFLLFLIPAAVNGQESNARAGSPYSGIAFGEPSDLLSPYTAGMGLTGVSSFDPYSVNSVNPSLWGLSGYSQGAIALGLQNYRAADDLETAAYNQFTFDQFQIVLPVVRSRLGVSFGFFPVTRSGFALSREEEIQFEGSSDPVGVINRTEGTGGVNKMELGIGYRISQNFSVGYAASLHFASISREYGTLFSSAEFNSLTHNENLSGISTGHRLGFHARHAGFLSGDDSIFLGAALSLPVHFDVDRSLTAFREVSGMFREVDLLPQGGTRSGEIELPLEFNLGLTYNPVSSVNVSAEYSEQLWGEAAYSFNPDQEQYLVNRSKIGMGVQFHPYMGNPGSFFSSFKYSAGITFDTGHLMIDNQNIETLMLHAGIGILPRLTRSSVDLSFQYGFRGSDTNSLVEEKIWGFKLSLNLAEIMFVQQRFQ